MTEARHILPVIVVAQFAGTSLWFVGNAALPELVHRWPDVAGSVGWTTSAVQLGFIGGTLLFSLAGVADRVPSHKLFCAAALAGAATNAASLVATGSFPWFVGTRLATGVSLAGIYPIGMKLAASWFREGLGLAIGVLVGALVLGTGFPHLLGTLRLPGESLILSASALAIAGGLAVRIWVPEGPAVQSARDVSVREALGVFAERGFRSAAFGYFGHMWELYAFWAFVPFAVRLALGAAAAPADVSLAAFVVIASGALGSVIGGVASRRYGSPAIAIGCLLGSAGCGLLSPAVFAGGAPMGVLGFLALWGAFVVADSPQLSAIAARSVPTPRVGTALTLMNAIGFAVTIPSITLLSALSERIPPNWLLVGLAAGPLVGVVSLARHHPRAGASIDASLARLPRRRREQRAQRRSDP